MGNQNVRKTIVSVLWYFVSICAAARADDVNAYTIRDGTFEISSKEYIFRSGKVVEKYDFTFRGILEGGGVDGRTGLPGPPGLHEVGFRTKSGKMVEYGERWKNDVITAFVSKFPKDVAEALIFEGVAKQRLEIQLLGRTAVRRVDLSLSNAKFVLWANVEMRQVRTEIKKKKGIKRPH